MPLVRRQGGFRFRDPRGIRDGAGAAGPPPVEEDDHSAPYTLHLTPYTFHRTPYTIHHNRLLCGVWG